MVIPWEFVYVIRVPVSIHGSDYAVKDSSYRDLIVAFSDVQIGPEFKAFRGSGVVIPWATDRILEKPTQNDIAGIDLVREDASWLRCLLMGIVPS